MRVRFPPLALALLLAACGSGSSPRDAWILDERVTTDPAGPGPDLPPEVPADADEPRDDALPPADPGPGDPGPVDPGPEDPGPTDPGPTDPGPGDPGPQDPGPSADAPDAPDVPDTADTADVPASDLPLLPPAPNHPVDTAEALVRILNLHQLAADTAVGIVHRIRGYDDPVCPGGAQQTDTYTYAQFQGACHVDAAEASLDLEGRYRMETPKSCTWPAPENPDKVWRFESDDLRITGVGHSSDGDVPVDLGLDFTWRREQLNPGLEEVWNGTVRWGGWPRYWTPCCNEALSIHRILEGTRVTGWDVYRTGASETGRTWGGVLDIAGEGVVEVVTLKPLRYLPECWRPYEGALLFRGAREAQIRFGYTPGTGTPQQACSGAVDTTHWLLDGVEQGPIQPNFWASLTICLIAINGGKDATPDTSEGVGETIGGN